MLIKKNSKTVFCKFTMRFSQTWKNKFEGQSNFWKKSEMFIFSYISCDLKINATLKKYYLKAQLTLLNCNLGLNQMYQHVTLT